MCVCERVVCVLSVFECLILPPQKKRNICFFPRLNNNQQIDSDEMNHDVTLSFVGGKKTQIE